jgi:hypothetical protein
MNDPALKGEVSKTKMLKKLFKPRLRRTDVVLHSIACCVANTSEKLPRTPEMSFPEMIPQPRMFMQKLKGCNTLKQLECFTNTHGGRHFNEKVDVVNSNVQFINAESILLGNFTNEPFTISPYTDELHWVFGIFGFPNKVKSILSESMLKTSQVHFFTPPNFTFGKFSSMKISKNAFISYQNKLNKGAAIPLSASKAEVPLPQM